MDISRSFEGRSVVAALALRNAFRAGRLYVVRYRRVTRVEDGEIVPRVEVERLVWQPGGDLLPLQRDEPFPTATGPEQDRYGQWWIRRDFNDVVVWREGEAPVLIAVAPEGESVLGIGLIDHNYAVIVYGEVLCCESHDTHGLVVVDLETAGVTEIAGIRPFDFDYDPVEERLAFTDGTDLYLTALSIDSG